MNKRYAVYTFVGLALALFYLFYKQVAKAQHDEAFRACKREIEKIRVEAAKIKPVDLYPFQQDYQQFGYLDKNKKVVIRPRFTQAGHFFEGRAIVADRNYYKGFINSQKETVIPHKFVWVW